MDPRLQSLRTDSAINRGGSVGSNATAFRDMFRRPGESVSFAGSHSAAVRFYFLTLHDMDAKIFV